jgi:GT2 family glycosyltransferase
MVKILVGCPTFEGMKYCINEYIDALKNLEHENYFVVLVDNSKESGYYEYLKKKVDSLSNFFILKDQYVQDYRQRIVNSRNLLRQYAIENHFDYFFSLEQDVIPPSNVVKKLLGCKKKVVSGVYYNDIVLESRASGKLEKVKVALLRIMMSDKKLYWLLPEVLKEPELIDVFEAGVGCMLIEVELLKKVNFRYDKSKTGFDDVCFCEDVRKLGYKVWALTDVVCEHLKQGKEWNWESV